MWTAWLASKAAQQNKCSDLQPKSRIQHTTTSWVKQTFLHQGNKATWFSFLKPSSGHTIVNQENYANVHSSILTYFFYFL
jgi:hypothetical protein